MFGISGNRRLLLGTASLVVATLVTSCRPDEQRTDSIDFAGAQSRASMPEGMPEQLDSGSVAFRAGDYEVALEHYERATELGADFAAGWFGVYMAHHALGNLEDAEAALARARDAAPGATMIHDPDGASDR